MMNYYRCASKNKSTTKITITITTKMSMINVRLLLLLLLLCRIRRIRHRHRRICSSGSWKKHGLHFYRQSRNLKTIFSVNFLHSFENIRLIHNIRSIFNKFKNMQTKYQSMTSNKQATSNSGT